MKNVTTILAAAAIGAAAVVFSIAPPAAADTSNCQQAGASSVCGQGDVRGGDQSPDGSDVPAGVLAPGPDDSGCTTPYGTYQNCNAGGGP